MTARAGEPFDTGRAVSDIASALSAPLPDSGPTTDEGEPVTGEWTSTRGKGLLLFPLWESEALTGVYGREWTDAEERAEANLAALTAELDARWGPHRRVPLGGPTFRRPDAEPFRTLLARDCNGDLAVWEAASEPVRRWVAVSLNQSDGDAPMILIALISDRPVPPM
ncbi:hypothetical protein HTV45_11775 [Streptomyces sp. CHD11]|uniref:hypothetical protein n=1 Tax=Streptomyces sp. CHD11 TaxID=2741325 RepID=UPI001BFCA7D9|nr:hypothetical protein [Streptomyces sp. CHD11]MBT3151554.1 hypothetical protein [Streptomyces sp. CHD11]